MLRYLDPNGLARAAVRRWWRGRRPLAAGQQVPRAQLVTCWVASSPADDLATRCRHLLQQTWRPFELLVVTRDPAVAGTLPRGVFVLEPDADRTEIEPDERLPWSGDCVLTAHGDAHPELLAKMVAALQQDPVAVDVRGSGDRLTADGGWRLRRRDTATRTTPGTAAIEVNAATRVEVPAGDAPFVLRFAADTDPDLPYRWRGVLALPRCRAIGAAGRTADRIALLSPPRQVPSLRPARPRTRLGIVLQADDFTEGGMEQVVIDLAEALRDHAFAPRLLVLGKQGSAADRARARGLPVDRVPAEAAAYTAYLAQQRPALVNAHFSTFGAADCAQRGVPFVQTIHNMYVWFGPEHVARYQEADRHTHAYLCVSNNVARHADLVLGLPPARMLVIPNGCHRDFVATPAHRAQASALRAELGLPAAARVLLSVASIQPPKAQHVLLGAFAHLAATDPSVHLVLLGATIDVTYEQQQRRTAERLGLGDRVHWVGRRDDVSAFHQLADALVQPSFFEGWSLAITEAVLAGLPVIATDVGGAIEQLHGTTGIVVPAAVADITGLHRDTLVPLLAAPCRDLQTRLAAAMRAVLARDGARSPLPEHWRSLLRDVAYRRCANVLHWLCNGGEPTSARAWLAAETGP